MTAPRQDFHFDSVLTAPPVIYVQAEPSHFAFAARFCQSKYVKSPQY